MDKQVYCRNCKYVDKRYKSFIWRKAWHCGIELDFAGYTNFIMCVDKNKNCDCKDYKRIWWKFWI